VTAAAIPLTPPRPAAAVLFPGVDGTAQPVINIRFAVPSQDDTLSPQRGRRRRQAIRHDTQRYASRRARAMDRCRNTPPGTGPRDSDGRAHTAFATGQDYPTWTAMVPPVATSPAAHWAARCASTTSTMTTPCDRAQSYIPDRPAPDRRLCAADGCVWRIGNRAQISHFWLPAVPLLVSAVPRDRPDCALVNSAGHGGRIQYRVGDLVPRPHLRLVSALRLSTRRHERLRESR
jgi:hypothetical protein